MRNRDPIHSLQWPSKFAQKLVSSLGWEAYAFSEMLGHITLLRDVYAPFEDVSPSMVGL